VNKKQQYTTSNIKHGHATRLHGHVLKKQYGQHFLRDQSVIDAMLEAVTLQSQSSIIEIGCGDGVLTKQLQTLPHERLWVFEIDKEWSDFVTLTYPHPSMTVFLEDFLQVDFSRFDAHAPWHLLANLPYQITFPLLHKIQQNRHLFAESVILVQEEVAQKLVATSGRAYNFQSFFFQWFFELKLLRKVLPSSFVPPPKIDSRLLYFKPRTTVVEMPMQEEFWKFIKACFVTPRRTIRNNIATYNFAIQSLPDDILSLRAQQVSLEQFIGIWNTYYKQLLSL
jgi:16S rRNA (adenine1518-N6/adenine1519-N6)-dimethyltransferase